NVRNENGKSNATKTLKLMLLNIKVTEEPLQIQRRNYKNDEKDDSKKNIS
ncbi:14584_t:CDS:1, partial [Racocetra persica]